MQVHINRMPPQLDSQRRLMSLTDCLCDRRERSCSCQPRLASQSEAHRLLWKRL